MTPASDVIRYVPCVYGEQMPMTFMGEEMSVRTTRAIPGNWKRSSVMSMGTFLFWQVATTVAMYMWYAKRHPEDAQRMKMSFMRMFSK